MTRAPQREDTKISNDGKHLANMHIHWEYDHV